MHWPDSSQLTACFDRWTTRRTPVVSTVDGDARAFAAAVALTSAFTLATPAASFGLPETSRGVVPSFAIGLLGTRHTSRLVREVALSTVPIAARDAAHRNHISAVVPDAEYGERCAHRLLSLWSEVGAATIRDAMQTLADVDAAPDLARIRRIAVAGVEEQLRRFGDGRTDQSYLTPE
ncbi:enoyl-CoA hydratase-related protein [Streptomyces rapamycinicus]|uniref:enoyl-CoA hydratase-related protein n=1 Tax=Streptomyces rapamycinicus TaxID=1226757 RepID=UPI0023EC62AF|nr:enoyl-CoA hydratase-related protein [Streptomyces rapamycinicus]